MTPVLGNKLQKSDSILKIEFCFICVSMKIVVQRCMYLYGNVSTWIEKNELLIGAEFSCYRIVCTKMTHRKSGVKIDDAMGDDKLAVFEYNYKNVHTSGTANLLGIVASLSSLSSFAIRSNKHITFTHKTHTHLRYIGMTYRLV